MPRKLLTQLQFTTLSATPGDVGQGPLSILRGCPRSEWSLSLYVHVRLAGNVVLRPRPRSVGGAAGGAIRGGISRNEAIASIRAGARELPRLAIRFKKHQLTKKTRIWQFAQI